MKRYSNNNFDFKGWNDLVFGKRKFRFSHCLMKVISIAWGLISMLSVGCSTAPRTEQSVKCGLIDSTTVILSVVYPDTLKGKMNDLLIFALLNKGKYTAIDDYDEKRGTDINQRDSIFQEVKTFYTHHKEKLVPIFIDSVVKAEFDCNLLVLGRFHSIHSFRKPLIASNFKLPCRSFYERIDAPSEDSLYYKITEDTLFYELRSKFKKINFDLIKIKGSDDFVCIANAEDKDIAVSNLYFVRLENHQLKLINGEKHELGVDSWGRGNVFLDCIDIDQDNVPEVFIFFHDYESTTIYIYKKEGNKYVKKLGNTIYGC